MSDERPTCDVCGLPATTTDGICGAELCDDPECFGVAWDRAFNPEKPVVERESRGYASGIVGAMWDNRNGPEGALTPESPGLTCITRRNRGARL